MSQWKAKVCAEQVLDLLYGTREKENDVLDQNEGTEAVLDSIVMVLMFSIASNSIHKHFATQEWLGLEGEDHPDVPPLSREMTGSPSQCVSVPTP